jgi:DNA mismatch endonuclease (patch repair protein)
MADVFDKEKRSKIMGLVRGKDTKPELIVRQFLHRNGYRYKLHDKKLPGSPDIKLTKYKTLIFINGCFWHKHQKCRPFILPKTNTEFWAAKIEKNVTRDRINQLTLNDAGWKVITIWECELKKTIRDITLCSLVKNINGE